MSETLYRTLFRLGIMWRIVYGAVRVAAGFTLLKWIGMPFSDLFFALMQHEIAEDPYSPVVQSMSNFLAHEPLTVTYFLATYLLFWGSLDLVLSFALLREWVPAFPINMILMSGFIGYEMVRFAHTHSLILLSIIVIDLCVVIVIHHEYRRLLLRLRETEVLA